MDRSAQSAVTETGRARPDLTAIPGPSASIAAPADIGRIVAAFLLAFAADPMVRWAYRDARQYLALFPERVRAYGGRALEQGTAQVTQDHAGAALWMAPGREPDYAGLKASLPPGRDADFIPLIEALAAYHLRAPHWYLAMIGVDPVHQRKGTGAALLEAGLRRCDADHVAAYLECSTAANVPFYQRHGFALLGTVHAGSAPPVFPMLRPAR